MPRGRTRIMAALIAGGLVAGSLGGGFALAASKSEEAMHHGHTMKHGSSTSHDPGMPEQGAAMSHGAAMHGASLTG